MTMKIINGEREKVKCLNTFDQDRRFQCILVKKKMSYNKKIFLEHSKLKLLIQWLEQQS